MKLISTTFGLLLNLCTVVGLSLSNAQRTETEVSAARIANEPRLSDSNQDPSNLTFNTIANSQNATNLSLNADDISYVCFKSPTEARLNVRSCADAVRQLDTRSNTPITWGPRIMDKHFQIALPRRFMSSDGTCYVEPFLKEGYESSVISQQSVAAAGALLTTRCAAQIPSRDGAATDLGGDNHLTLLLSGYEHRVRCFGQISRATQFRQNCQSLLETMDVSESKRTFGPPGSSEDVDVSLPASFQAGYVDRCTMTITTSSSWDQFSWAGVWEVATAIDAVCIRAGKQGRWDNIGLQGRLSVQITHESVSQE